MNLDGFKRRLDNFTEVKAITGDQPWRLCSPSIFRGIMLLNTSCWEPQVGRDLMRSCPPYRLPMNICSAAVQTGCYWPSRLVLGSSNFPFHKFFTHSKQWLSNLGRFKVVINVFQVISPSEYMNQHIVHCSLGCKNFLVLSTVFSSFPHMRTHSINLNNASKVHVIAY